ncbi:sigma-54-dependent Fis family transcriptional regulator [Sphingomonas sp. M1A8_2b]
MGALVSGNLEIESSANALVVDYSERLAGAAWERFLSGDSPETVSARPHVLASWQRCQQSQVDYRADAAPRIEPDGMGALRRTNRELLQAAASTLAYSADFLSGTRSVMLLTDANGIVLDSVGDIGTLHAANDIALARGGNWREDAGAGTNGIGTSLATGMPVSVHAGEHYCAGIKGWSCAGAPIIDPLDGSVAGILGISARKQESSAQILALAVLAANGIRQTLTRHSDQQRLQLLEMGLDHSHRRPGDGLIALDDRGRILFASPRTRELLMSRLERAVPILGRGVHLMGPNGALDRELLDEWLYPLLIDGDVAGNLVIVPAAAQPRSQPARPQVAHSHPARAQAGRTRTADESDGGRSRFDSIVGTSDALRGAIRQAQAVAPLDVPVLVLGETGTGKELFARAIHGESKHAEGPFVAFNCGAVSREMIASELFGYARGAFTGADPAGRAGRFELAEGGTLCLDEIGELALDLQPYLLRMLEEGVVTRIGESTPRKVNVRIIAMTNRNLRDEVAAGRFRLDLFHRLSIVEIVVPPLRDRPGDLRQLIDYFNPRIADRHHRTPVSFTTDVMAALQAHSWPGNVRELRNVVERLILFSRDGIADVDSLPAGFTDAQDHSSVPTVSPGSDTMQISGEQISGEREKLENAMRRSGGNLSAAAKLLGISRSTLYRKMAKFAPHRYDPQNSTF